MRYYSAMHHLCLESFWVISLASFVACSPGEQRRGGESPAESSRKDRSAAKRYPVPDGPPPADVVRKLEFHRYELIEEAGGLPLTLTATGKSMVVHPKLYRVEVEECTPSPQGPPGDHECSLRIQLSLARDGGDPSWQGERISISWDGEKGAWKTP